MFESVPPQSDFERRVQARAKEFEIGPLLRVLERHGYSADEVFFVSNSDYGAVSSMVEGVRFYRTPIRAVSICVNIGLLGASGLLPSYFFEMTEKSGEFERFERFINFFDHKLIENFLTALYPELDKRLYQNWARVGEYYFKMLGVGSVATLAWLFQAYFPELRVDVRRNAMRSATSAHAFRTGASKLDGSWILGKAYEADSPGFQVEIYADEEANDSGEAWPQVVRDRMRRTVLPKLHAFEIALTVGLTVLSHASWVTIDSEGYLGYERIRDRGESGHRILIYQGETGMARG